MRAVKCLVVGLTPLYTVVSVSGSATDHESKVVASASIPDR